jgi:hypothetical protein
MRECPRGRKRGGIKSGYPPRVSQAGRDTNGNGRVTTCYLVDPPIVDTQQLDLVAGYIKTAWGLQM